VRSRKAGRPETGDRRQKEKKEGKRKKNVGSCSFQKRKKDFLVFRLLDVRISSLGFQKQITWNLALDSWYLVLGT